MMGHVAACVPPKKLTQPLPIKGGPILRTIGDAANYILGAEVVCCNERGVATFQLLRHRQNEPQAFLYAFDLLELNGTDLRREPIEVRKATLASILRKALHGVRLNDHLEHDSGLTVFQHACKHYGCSTARNKGTCDNRLTVRQEMLEGLVIGALQSRLMDPALLAEFCDEYTRHMNRLRMERNASLGAARGELSRLAKQRENIIQAIKDGVPATEVKDDLARVVMRREELENLLAGTKEEPVPLHPNMAAEYHKRVANLAAEPERKQTRSGRYFALAH
jgi:ATP dependent DNA ligase domain